MHLSFMQQALLISEQGRYNSPPNPWVGCVIVNANKIVGTGFTQPPGQAHAEIMALNEAKENARNGTLYVTLEPCSHFGRTPPCVNAIIEAGIKHVFVALEDPDKRVKGTGIQRLRAAGIKVEIGLCEQEARSLLAPYLYHRTTGLPFTIVKAAMSIDARTAAADGTSQWITPPEAREDVHLQRAASQAIIVGAGTAIKDQPRLNVRHPTIHLNKQPLRIVLDTSGKVPAHGPLFDTTIAPTWMITTEKAPENVMRQWQEQGAEVSIISSSESGVNLQEAWQLIGQKDILQVFVEGGSTLQTALIQTQLVNQLSLYVGSILLGKTGLPLFLKEISTLNEAVPFQLQHVKQIGNCARLDYTKII